MLKPSDWLLDPRGCPGYRSHEVVARREASLGPEARYIHHTEHLHVQIPRRYALVNVTERIEEALARSEVSDGLCLVSTMHITAGVYINDAESGLLHDIAGWIENLAPFGKDYLHHRTGEDNGDAHLKSYLTNHALTLPVTGGKFDFGTWQQVFYAEFDGNRRKRLLLKFTGMA